VQQGVSLKTRSYTVRFTLHSSISVTSSWLCISCALKSSQTRSKKIGSQKSQCVIVYIITPTPVKVFIAKCFFSKDFAKMCNQCSYVLYVHSCVDNKVMYLYIAEHWYSHLLFIQLLHGWADTTNTVIVTYRLIAGLHLLRGWGRIM